MPEISVRWPFYRYDVLMPEHIPADIFVWLYLSLFVHINQQAGKKQESYAQDEKNQVKRLIKEEFSNIIDDTTLNKIIQYAEKDYVVRDETISLNETKKVFDPKAFDFIESFGDLFSSNLQIKHIYQDAITGAIVPVFEDMPYLQDCAIDEYKRLNLLVTKKPSLEKIKAAYKNYLKMLKNISNKSDMDNESPFEDPDAEVDFDPLNEDAGFDETTLSQSSVQNHNFYIKYVDVEHKKILFNYKVDLSIENEKICVNTPFDTEKTLIWMNKRFREACNICPELKELLKENKIRPQEANTRENDITYQKNVAYQLDVCGAIYRLAESVNVPNPNSQNIGKIIDDLKTSLIKIDKYFTGKSDSYFNQIGLYLECLISPLIDDSDKGTRRRMTQEFFKTQIRTICSRLHLKWDFLMKGEDIFREYQKARRHFKADVSHIVISNPKFLKCSSLYYEFIEDTFNLYNLRNQHEHYRVKQALLDKEFKKEYIEMLYKVTKVFFDLY
jgi:hypothetical protein